MGTWTLKYPKNGYPYRVYSCFEYLMPSLVWFKKTWTNCSTVSLLWFIQVFLNQTLDETTRRGKKMIKVALPPSKFVSTNCGFRLYFAPSKALLEVAMVHNSLWFLPWITKKCYQIKPIFKHGPIKKVFKWLNLERQGVIWQIDHYQIRYFNIFGTFSGLICNGAKFHQSNCNVQV